MRARTFRQLAPVFLVRCAVLVAGVLCPFQPLDPAWQSRLTGPLSRGHLWGFCSIRAGTAPARPSGCPGAGRSAG
jgi:hypothetical protein